MRRGSRFLIGLAAAGLTFGTLMATLGPRHHYQRGCYNNSYCGEQSRWHHDQCAPPEQTPNAPSGMH